MNSFTNPKWTALSLNGLIAVAIGLVFIFLPHALVATIVQIIGAILSVSGLGLLGYNFFNKKNGVYNVYHIFQGILNIAVGMVMIFEPQLMVDFIFFVIGLWTVAIGLFQIVYALRVRKIVNSGIFLLGNGIAFLGLGLIMIINPSVIVNTMLIVIGSVITLLGFILVYFSFLVYKSNKANSPQEFIDAEVIDE